jgi:uncharacterized membrane protein
VEAMAAEDPPNRNPPDLALVVSELTARVYRLEETVASLAAGQHSPQTATYVSEPRRADLRTDPRTEPPPRPVLRPLQSSIALQQAAAPKASLEDRLGSQIFNRIAIVAILIGAALGLKLAIDNHLIGPLGRVLIGLVSGAGVIVWSERFRRKEFAAFSYSLKAIGSGVLYLSLWAAFQLYHLIPSEAAFGLMLLVTLWNAWMAWAQSSELLAAYAIAGGFATPLLISTGGNHQVFLFSYVLTIDLATIALVRLEQGRKMNWSPLLIGAIAATIAYFIGWYVSFYSPDQLVSSSVFVALFFLAFLTVPLELAKPAEEDSAAKVPSLVPDGVGAVLLPLANAIFGSLAFYSILIDSGHRAALPWVALVLAALYLAVMRLPQSLVARAVHLSLAVLFLTITIPLKASGRWITIGWVAEGVALLWISARLESDASALAETGATIHRMLRRLASVALILGFLGLTFDAFWTPRPIHTALFNLRFATEVAGILALGMAAYISVRAAAVSNADSKEVVFPEWLQLAAASTIALNFVALLAGIREIDTYFHPAYTYSAESNLQSALSISGFFMLYGAALLALGFWKESPFLRWQALVLIGIAIVKTFLYDVRSLSQGYRVASFLGLGVLLLGISFFYVRRSTPPSSENK